MNLDITNDVSQNLVKIDPPLPLVNTHQSFEQNPLNFKNLNKMGMHLLWYSKLWQLTNWNAQNTYLCNKASNTLAFIHHNLYGCPQDVKEKCSNVLVRPIQEYGSCSAGTPPSQTDCKSRKNYEKSC